MSFNAERIAKLNKQRLLDVNPALRQKVIDLIEQAKVDGYNLLVTSGYRSNAQQNALYAQGRTKPGKIVTNARGGQSKHNIGRAVDLVFIVDGDVSWDIKLFKKIGAWAKLVGLAWGGNNKKFKDYPHVELREL